MQGWQYDKGLIYLRPIFRLRKLSKIVASLAFGFVLIPTSSDVWQYHLYIRDHPARKNQSFFFTR